MSWVTCLHGKTAESRRAKLLIDIAHPDDREMLDKFCASNDLNHTHCNIIKPIKRWVLLNRSVRISGWIGNLAHNKLQIKREK